MNNNWRERREGEWRDRKIIMGEREIGRGGTNWRERRGGEWRRRYKITINNNGREKRGGTGK